MARSIKKGAFVAPSLLKKMQNSDARTVVKTWKRSSVVIPDFVGKTISVHDGRKFVPVFISENMVGHALGEFVPTRTFRMHSGQRKLGKK